MFRALLAVSGFFILASTAHAQRNPEWIVTKTEWTEADEIGFGKFVATLARTKCSTIDECLRSPNNPYRDTDPDDYMFWSDCADLPYFLRAYYAWKNQLPFSYVSGIASNDPEPSWNPWGNDGWGSEEDQEWVYERVPVRRPWWQGGGVVYETRAVRKPKGRDVRYSKNGNRPTQRRRMAPTADGSRVNFITATDTMQNTISSGSLRFGPDVQGDVDTDLYPIDINTEAVRPGAVAYSPMGHVAIVYDVTDDGRILLFNAHPADRNRPGTGTPVSRSTYETRKEFVLSRPEHGSGLKQWRPFRIVNPKWKNGKIVGGSFAFAGDGELPNRSTVQFFGTNFASRYQDAKFVVRGKTVPYETFLRLRLARAKIDPLKDFQGRLNDACELFKGRVSSVQGAVDANLHRQSHPSTLPTNIFSANGTWEDYATPSRDVRLRVIFHNLRLDLSERLAAIRAKDPSVVRRPNLRAELLAAYAETARACSITYRNSAGRAVTLGFDQLVARLTKISFDPYHCPERRWGAEGAELSTCTDNANKKAWYDAEAIVRHHLDKDWKASGPIDITDLQYGRVGFGKPKAPDLDVKSFIERIPDAL